MFFGTFILEDVALISSLVLIGEGKISVFGAFWALFLGISIGDIGLYFIGRFAAALGLERRINQSKKLKFTLAKLKDSAFMNYIICGSRLIPGTRLPTYLAAGILRFPFTKFVGLTVLSVGTWVAFALLAGKTLHYFLMDNLLLFVILLFAFLTLAKNVIPLIFDQWQRKACKHSWRKWLSFEFWPAWFFYIPIALWYVFLSIRHRSFLIPFYANPNIANAGLLGESKWDFLVHLDSNHPATLKSVKVKKNTGFDEWLSIVEDNSFQFPFILKPDVGQRGFGVRIIRDEFDLTEYLLLSDFDILIQELATNQNEAGVFYIRYPQEKTGKLFSITDKEFPFIVGDGKTKLGDLILSDKRSRIIAPTYFERLHEKLDIVPVAGEKIQLAECGNHCQGAIFLNGEQLMSTELLNSIESLARRIPHFYFGRFDIRYANPFDLRAGEFQIIEINGAGAEATHIWDAKTKLIEAYKTLFTQWKILFEIGDQVKRDKMVKSNIQLALFIKESFKVYFRKEKLSVSS